MWIAHAVMLSTIEALENITYKNIRYPHSIVKLKRPADYLFKHRHIKLQFTECVLM